MTYPTITPKLTLDFANSRQLDPRITFSRSSTATYLHPDTGLITTAPSGVARFEKEGLLIEEARTNKIPESTNLNNTAYWSTSTNPGSMNQATNQGWFVASSNTTEILAPDGTNSATKLSGDTTSTNDKNYAVHVVPNISQVPMTQNTVYTYTVFVNDPDSIIDGTNNTLVFMHGSMFSNTNARADFDLVNDTVTFGGSIANQSGSIESYPNGWKKLTATFSNTASSGGARYYLQEHAPRTNSVTQFSSNGEKIYVFGFQIEEGNFPTSYIPTSGSTVTRAADLASMIGTNFSSWYNNSEGTFLCEFNHPFAAHGDDRIFIAASSNASADRIGAQIRNTYQVTRTLAKTNSVNISADMMTGTDGSLSPTLGVGYSSATNGFRWVQQGVVRTATGTPSTAIDRLLLGQTNAGGATDNKLSGHIFRLSYYDRRVSDAALQSLTS